MNDFTIEQQNVFDKIKNFINSEKQVFILKGAAGSGKTTLISMLVESLAQDRKLFQIMAPTGRAAKVLRDKIMASTDCAAEMLRKNTKLCSTIHRGIYDFRSLECIEVESDDPAHKSFHYYFPLVNALNVGDIASSDPMKINIIDESSMISDVESKQELFSFGTGRLLSDLITYAGLSSGLSKLILVGDNAQLPPVTDPVSRALTEEYFLDQGLSVESHELQTIHRQLQTSGILQNATNIRNILKQPRAQRKTLKINKNGDDVKSIPIEEVATDYTNRFPIPEVGNGVIIAYSNAQTMSYNHSVRSKIFPANEAIIAGDVVLINRNNYYSYGLELFNGDMAMVVEAETPVEKITTPVYVEKHRIYVEIIFRNIMLKFPNYDEIIHCKIIDSLLNSPHRDLSVAEMKALYIDFCIRFNNEQKKRKGLGLPTYREGSQEFKDMLRIDPYYNALQIKYGYAVTCHKAQGGEWSTVFVDYSGRVGLHDDALRWCYTATTRAKKELIITNFPDIDVFDRLKFSSITMVGKADSRYYQKSNLYPTPYHSINANLGKRLKYDEIINKICNTPYTLKELMTKDYLEKYTFEVDGIELVVDLYHDGAGIFKDLEVQGNNESENCLKRLINEPFEQEIPVLYRPTNQLFQELNQKISSICCELNIQITNVLEEPQKYHVLYCLKTSGKFSMIQFYYNQKNGFTTAMPKSDIGDADDKLTALINLLSI